MSNISAEIDAILALLYVAIGYVWGRWAGKRRALAQLTGKR